MSLVSLITFDDGSVQVITEDVKIEIDSVAEYVKIFCKETVHTPAGTYQKDFDMVADNSFHVPVVDQQGNPIWENPEALPEDRIQKTIGEYQMLDILIDQKIVTMRQAVASAILRRKGLSTEPYVFVEG